MLATRHAAALDIEVRRIGHLTGTALHLPLFADRAEAHRLA